MPSSTALSVLAGVVLNSVLSIRQESLDHVAEVDNFGGRSLACRYFEPEVMRVHTFRSAALLAVDVLYSFALHDLLQLRSFLLEARRQRAHELDGVLLVPAVEVS